jgi:hypothetical protein
MSHKNNSNQYHPSIIASPTNTLFHNLIRTPLTLLPTPRKPSSSIEIPQGILLRPWHQSVRTGRLLTLFKLCAHLGIHCHTTLAFFSKIYVLTGKLKREAGLTVLKQIGHSKHHQQPKTGDQDHRVLE